MISSSSATTPSKDASTSFLVGGGDVGALIRDQDWSETLGPLASWPGTIKTAVSLCLRSRFPILLWVGPELRILYNDAYIPFLGAAKHPTMLGAPGCEAWSEIWDDIAPMLAEAVAGRAIWVDDYPFFFTRELLREETYVTFSYSPIFNADAVCVEGVFCVCTETTRRVVGERRLSTLRALGMNTAQQRTADDACRDAAAVLQDNPSDIAFAALYLCDGDGTTTHRAAVTHLASEVAALPLVHPLNPTAAAPWPLDEAKLSGRPVIVSNTQCLAGTIAAPLWPDPVRTTVVLSLATPASHQPVGFLIIGTSPRQVFDEDYRSFLELVAEHVLSAIVAAHSFDEERKRAEALLALDHAKTKFFANVSHEFRTPLTLILGPLRELLAKPADIFPADVRALVEIAERNSVRLLRLVTSLLDFSRIEAGRAEACYEPTDLAKLTSELAASFQSACESGGLTLEINAPPLPEPIYVDRDMWEKIILNLISNAFKFTFEGRIAVRLCAVPTGAELRVSDSGIGIPTKELPRLFERFHRIEGRRSRSHEGSGIGLALVHELVRLHGGTISVESRENEGSTFIVTIPCGTAHLPTDQIGRARRLSSTTADAGALLDEMRRWLPTSVNHSTVYHGLEPAPRILIADDNADMRDYLVNLLRQAGWSVHAVADGDTALASARFAPPDLLLADVMMPGLDGLSLVAALRQEPRLATLPAILLSARAGEEARIAGMQSGADDYLVKPFSARELIARTEAILALARLRQETNDRIQRSEARLQAAVDLVGLSSYRWDPRVETLEWDDRLRSMWGLPPNTPVQINTFLQAIHPEDRPRVEAAIAACVDPASGGVYHLEYRVIGVEDGVERWVSTHGQTWFENDIPVDFIGAALDVTERKQVEERLQASEERFRQFAEHSANLLWIVDVETMRIEYRSPAFERIWGVARDAAPSDLASWAESIHPDDRAAVHDALLRVQQGEAVAQEFRVLRPDGAVRWVRDTAFPIRNEFGRIHRIGGITVDVTRVEGTWAYIVDGGEASRRHLAAQLHSAGYDVKTFATTSDFLEVAPMLLPGCALLELSGCGDEAMVVPRELKVRGIELPVIVVGGVAGDVRTAVKALKAGAADWLEGSYEPQALLAAVADALAKVHDAQEAGRRTDTARIRIASMSQREREVLEGMVAGETNKEVARRLGISPRTVEIHRAHVMDRLGVRSLSEAVLLAAAAGLTGLRTGEPK